MNHPTRKPCMRVQGRAIMASELVASTEDEEWDTEGFEIPSLTTVKDDNARKEEDMANDALKFSSHKVHSEDSCLKSPGELTAQAEQPEISPFRKKQRFRNILKGAENKVALPGHENKVDVLCDLMGGMPDVELKKGGLEEWLDPHCQESMFEKSNA